MQKQLRSPRDWRRNLRNPLLIMSGMYDSQQYPLQLYLIKNE